jgi:protocatechuate 3,4-dioxygenase beta subunit
LRIGLALAAFATLERLHAATALLGPTPQLPEGPFFPSPAADEVGADPTQVADPSALGEILNLRGRVFGDDAHPVAGALVIIWQANTWGRYHHPADGNPAPLDAGFRGWGRATTDGDGRLAFRTVVPGPYPISDVAWRAPHINVRVRRDGYRSLTTQLFLPRHGLNSQDEIYRALSDEQRARVSLLLQEPGFEDDPDELHASCDLVLARLRQG